MQKDEAIQNLKSLWVMVSSIQNNEEVQKYVDIEDKHLDTLVSVINFLESH